MKLNKVTLILSAFLGLVSTNAMATTSDVWNGAASSTINKGIDEIGETVTQYSTDRLKNQVLTTQANMNKAITQRTATAYEQGFETEEMKLAKLKAEEDKANDTPRQRGEVVHVPYERDTVIKDKKLKQWLNNWAYILEDVGVKQEKTYFEAARLNKEDFESWANEVYLKYK